MNMESNFVPYELSLDLKSIGFDEPCLYAWCEKGGWNPYKGVKEDVSYILKTDGNPFGTFFNGKDWNNIITSNIKSKIKCSAPLFQQAYRFIREIYKIQIFFDYFYYDGFHYGFKWVKSNGEYGEEWYDNEDDPKGWDTIEDTELEGLKKLIELAKQNK